MSNEHVLVLALPRRLDRLNRSHRPSCDSIDTFSFSNSFGRTKGSSGMGSARLPDDAADLSIHSVNGSTSSSFTSGRNTNGENRCTEGVLEEESAEDLEFEHFSPSATCDESYQAAVETAMRRSSMCDLDQKPVPLTLLIGASLA
eukprot:6177245-Pleurochrysis_carterae.AAC.9